MRGRRNIKVRKHQRQTPSGSITMVKNHNRNIQDKRKGRKGRGSRKTEITKIKDWKKTAPRAVVMLQIRNSRVTKEFDPKYSSIRQTDRELASIANKNISIVGFAIEEKERFTDYRGKTTVKLKIIPVLNYSRKDLNDPIIKEQLYRDLEQVSSDLVEARGKIFKIQKQLNPEMDYEFSTGTVLHGMERIPYNNYREKERAFYSLPFYLVNVNADGTLNYHTKADVTLIPELQPSSFKSGAEFKWDPRVHSMHGELYREKNRNNTLKHYIEEYNNYERILDQLNTSEHLTNKEKQDLKNDQWKSVSRLAKLQDITALQLNKAGIPVIKTEEFQVGKAKPSGMRSQPIKEVRHYRHPNSFKVRNLGTGKIIEMLELKRKIDETDERLKILQKEKESTGKASFYIDDAHYFEGRKDVRQGSDVLTTFPLREITMDYKDKKWRFPQKFGTAAQGNTTQEQIQKRNVVWLSDGKIHSLTKINNKDLAPIERQREWNTMTRNAIKASITDKQQLKELKLLKKEPIALSDSEKKIVTEITGMHFSPIPGGKIVYAGSKYRPKKVRKYHEGKRQA